MKSLFAYGRRAAGFSLFLKDGRLWFDYNLAGRHTVVTSPQLLVPGTTSLAARLQLADEPMVELLADGGSLCAAPIPMGFPAGFGLLSSQCGMNSPSPVSPEYLAPNVFTGTLREVEIELGEDDRVAIEGLWAAALKRQ